MKKIVLAYSGGLDTSVIAKWYREKYDVEVIAYCANLGQGVEKEGVHEKAVAAGASHVYIEDLTEQFLTDYAFPSLRAAALYEGVYPLATALGRPLIAKRMVEIAREHGADAVGHGCTGKGNDQVRFDVAFAHLAPDLKVDAPLRYWEFKSREEEIAYVKKHKIPIEVTADKPYSLDMNIWGQSVECGVLEDPWNAAPEDAFFLTQSPESAPDKAEEVTISFEKGNPVAVDGEKLSAQALVEKLHALGSRHGIGRIDLVENRLIGIKSREIYEAPAAHILHTAHDALEKLTLAKDVFQYKQKIALDYANQVYNGLWFTPLRSALQAFVDSSQEYVTGDVVLKLYKGSVTLLQRRSPYSLYVESLATYSENDDFQHQTAEGFIHCFSLPSRVVGQIQK